MFKYRFTCMDNLTEHNSPLLSLCIPTYNRAEILAQCLEKHIEAIGDERDIEIVISDNASTDNTREVVADFIERHGDIRIVYHRNEENIRDKNFFEVFRHARGRYLKLLNDYTYYGAKGMRIMIDGVRRYPDEETPLFFYMKLRKEPTDCVAGVDEFVRSVNNKLTWISNFGIWRSRLGELADTLDRSGSQLLQCYWTLSMVERHPARLVDIRDVHLLPVPGSKRVPYNFFVPHVANYYTLLSSYGLSAKTLRYDKTVLLWSFVGKKAVDYLILKKECPFELEGSWKILWRHFKGIPYFYMFIPVTLVRDAIKGLRDLGRIIRGKHT